MKDVTNIADVEYAILETSGQLSVILKSDKRPVQPKDMNIAPAYEDLPRTLIMDGHVIHQNLKIANKDISWLETELSKSGVKRFQDVLFATLDSQGQLFYQRKSSVK